MVTVVYIPGDGIGPEVTSAARRVLDATGVGIDWVDAEAGEQVYERTGSTIPDRTVELVREVGLALKGPMANPIGQGYRSPNIALRQAADLYANVRLATGFPGARTRYDDVDLVVIREVSEDVYSGVAQYVGPDAAIAVKFVTRAASQRIARFAFEYARRHGLERVTIAHKAGTLKETDGLFLAAVSEVAVDYPDLTIDEDLIDALVMHLVREPSAYQVLLAPFQYGDILADLCAGIVGGLGLAPGASFGDHVAYFEAAHGSAPKYAGKDRVNPTALILSGALLLDHIGEVDAARRVREAVRGVIAEGTTTTYDLGGSAGTVAMTDAVIARMEAGDAGMRRDGSPMSAPTALVIGGTGPTGPGVVQGLLDRGFEVTVLHGGQHEADLPAQVPHVHADPHFAETLEPALGGRSFDLVVAQYGRLRIIADLLRGRTGRLVAIGGATGSLAAADDPRWGRAGRPAVVTEEREQLERDAGRNKFGLRMAEAETAVLDAHRRGDYEATYLAYPIVYGPRVLVPHEWAVIRRLQEGRRQLIVADGGLKVETRLHVDNAVAAVLRVLDRWEDARGEKFVIADTDAFSMRQRIELVADRLGIGVELVDVPYAAAGPCHPYWRHERDNRIRPNEKSRWRLGYVDAVPADEALAATVDWLVAHPPRPGGEEEVRLGDPFDYAEDDRVIEAWLEVSRQGAAAPRQRAAHPYRHPQAPDEAWRPRGV